MLRLVVDCVATADMLFSLVAALVLTRKTKAKIISAKTVACTPPAREALVSKLVVYPLATG